MSQSPENPNTNPNELHEKTQAILSKIDQLGTDYLPYVVKNNIDPTVALIALDVADGRRIIIKKVMPDGKKNRSPDNFLQDTIITIYSGEMRGQAEFSQEDFNYNEKGDGLMRRRTIAHEAPGAESVPGISSYDTDADIAKKAFAALFNAQNAVANMGLEEQTGVNNQPATAEQLDLVSKLLDDSAVLDPNDNYKPVKTQ